MELQSFSIHFAPIWVRLTATILFAFEADQIWIKIDDVLEHRCHLLSSGALSGEEENHILAEWTRKNSIVPRQSALQGWASRMEARVVAPGGTCDAGDCDLIKTAGKLQEAKNKLNKPSQEKPQGDFKGCLEYF